MMTTYLRLNCDEVMKTHKTTTRMVVLKVSIKVRLVSKRALNTTKFFLQKQYYVLLRSLIAPLTSHKSAVKNTCKSYQRKCEFRKTEPQSTTPEIC